MVQNILVLKCNDEDRKWPQILAIILASLSALSCGLLFAWTSPFIPKISKDKLNYNISEEEASYFAVLPPVVMLFSSPFMSKLCDIVGRKKTLLLIAIPYISALIMKAIAISVYVFYLARGIVGIGDGILFAALPMYIGEVATPEVRGFWGNAVTFFIFFGQFCVNVIGIYLNVQQTSYICLVIPVTFVLFFPLMPESPYFYLMKGEDEQAKKSLMKLGRKEAEFVKMKKDVCRQMSESRNWKDLFLIVSNQRALRAGAFLRVSQQLSGIAILSLYTKYIFEKSETDIDPNMSTILYSGLCSFLNIIATFTVDWIGRKKSYVGSLLLCTFALGTLSAYFYIDQFMPQLDIKFLQWLPLAGMIWYVVFSSFGVAIIPTLMLGELFSASIKAKGLTILILVFGIVNFVNTYFFYVLNSNFGFYSPFLFYTICSVISIVLSIKLVPETTGKTLEEIQQSLKSNKKK